MNRFIALNQQLTGEMEEQFWKIKAPACFLRRPPAPANANSGVVHRFKRLLTGV